MEQPLISLITVVFNAEQVLDSTLRSAVNQTYKNIELVIVDGGSTDQTLQIANQYAEFIGTVISEKDKGIYDAMNKGIRAAKGEWIYFLNAGDAFFENDTLEKIFTNNKLHTIDFIYGKIQTKNEPTGVNYQKGSEVEIRNFYTSYPICHQATFARKKVFEIIGLFDISYRLASDTEWFVRLFKKQELKRLYIDQVIAYYDIQGATYQKRMAGYREYLRFGLIHFPWYINVRNFVNYPFIWMKVKLIRALTGTAFFAYYRKLKFKSA